MDRYGYILGGRERYKEVQHCQTASDRAGQSQTVSDIVGWIDGPMDEGRAEYTPALCPERAELPTVFYPGIKEYPPCLLGEQSRAECPSQTSHRAEDLWAR